MKLELDGLTKEFGDFTAVNHINLTMTNGVYGLLGVNGAGKTTLMRMLCTLLKPTSGTICCNGKDIFSMDSEYRKLLGYLPQDFGFYPEFTVEDYLLYIGALKGIRPIVVKKRVKELIAKVGLSKVAHKKMKKLSGGMKRRAGIAQAMLNNPKILILDEPTVGLDPFARRMMWQMIRDLHHQGLTFILTTHYMEEAQMLCHRVAFMRKGCVLGVKTPEDWILQLGRFAVDHFENETVKTYYFNCKKEAITYTEHLSSDFLLRETNLEDVFLETVGKGIPKKNGNFNCYLGKMD